jgi:hypothetical protein
VQERVVRSHRYSVAAKVRVAASLKKKLALRINSLIILLVLREHLGRLLLLILPHNLVNGRALRACQKKKSRNRARPMVHQQSSSLLAVAHQKTSRRFPQTRSEVRQTIHKARVNLPHRRACLVCEVRELGTSEDRP